MRIIGGTFRGRKLKTPKDAFVRPTTDRLRESIFSSLEQRVGGFHGKKVADIFAGTGALGLEALSRGAKSVTFVEKNGSSLSLLKENIGLLGVREKAEILSADAANLPQAKKPFDIIFVDPPYGRGLAGPALKSLLAGKWLSKETIVSLEMDKKETLGLSEELEIVKTLAQGFRRVYFIKEV